MSKNQKQHQNKSQKQKFEEEKPNTVAFVLCHPIDSKLSPISKEIPPCLFPLCNIPVLFYNLHWLHTNDVDKIYIVCQDSHEKVIRKYLNEWQETIKFKSIEILPTSTQTQQINSIGDSIRWIYSSSSVVLNFNNCIIIPGTLVTNVPLKQVLNEHEKRMKKPAKKGKGKPILTTIFTQNKIDQKNGYSALLENDGTILQLDIPSDIDFIQKERQIPFQKEKTQSIKTGLKDTQIYICAPELMEVFVSDCNFNWNSIMNDCVASTVALEIDKKSVHATVLQDSFFAAQINDLQSYMDASLAVIHKRMSPIVLEANLSSASRSYSLFFDDEDDENEEEEEENLNDDDFEVCLTEFKLVNESVYFDRDVSVSSSSSVGPSVVVGSSTKIGNNCKIENCVIGSECTIGDNVVMKDSIIWDRVVIEEGAKIDNCLVASDTNIKKDVKVNFGCVLSFNVIVDVDLPPCRRLTGYEIGDNNEKEIEFRADVAPKWLKNYIKNKKPLPSSECSYFEYRPSTESEIPFLHLWRKLSPDTFPIDIENIEKEDEVQEDEDDDEEEEDILY
ncbi:Translation initiation factor eIF-2B subunit epsilon [Tritrichomonas musculus]|uniref:Translation initiation factor eIF-2B subunit epsilon n=1 Tax=Tritrichomonas musculus TaxID=1915356 RepID=A0ABR2GZL6_9EUKA